jgi:hypothetical protein
MNVIAIINDLRRELERIDGLILALESLRAGRRRGRPPKALQALRAGAGPTDSPTAKRAAEVVQNAAKQPKKRTKKASKASAKKKSNAKG